MWAWRKRRADRDAGVTLVEMLVATSIFTIIATIITASVITMLEQSRKQGAQTTNLTSARIVIQMLDHQVRYANAVSTPGTGTDGSFYMEFRTGYTNLQQTCTQWRYVPTGGKLQSRTWQPPLAGIGGATPSAWATRGSGFSLVGATPIFAITPPTSLAGTTQTAQNAADTHYQVTITFNSSSGAPAVTTQSQVTVTAINSTRNPASATPPSVCTENGRP